MPEENIRIVVTGHVRASDDFSVVVIDRNVAQKLAEDLQRETEATEAEVRAALREATRGA